MGQLILFYLNVSVRFLRFLCLEIWPFKYGHQMNWLPLCWPLLWHFENIALFEHPKQPDNSNIDSTNSVSLGWGYLCGWPIACQESIWGNLFDNLIMHFYFFLSVVQISLTHFYYIKIHSTDFPQNECLECEKSPQFPSGPAHTCFHALWSLRKHVP